MEARQEAGTKTEIISKYREANTHAEEIYETPVTVFTKKDYEKFMSGTITKATECFAGNNFIETQVGKFFN